jgi:hypothetical protein
VPRGTRTRLSAATLGCTAIAVAALGIPSQAATTEHRQATSPTIQEGSVGSERDPGHYDARDLTGNALSRSERQIVTGRSAAQSGYYHRLGADADIQIDPLTHTPSQLSRGTGFLTGRSSRPARTIAMDFVRSHRAALGLTKGDLGTFRFRHDYDDTAGIHHLSWTQQIGGLTVFGNGLKVNVTRHGQVVSVQGSPVAGLAGLASQASTASVVTAPSARTRAARDVHGALLGRTDVTSSRSGSSAETIWSNHDYAKKVWFLTPTGLRSSWSTYTQTTNGGYQHVIDAATGRVLLRQSLTSDANGDAKVYDNYPGAKRGGKPRIVNFFKRGWLKKRATFLNGSSVIAFTDVNDDNALQRGERTKVPGTKHAAQFKLKRYGRSASKFCTVRVCTWNPHVGGSWKRNRQEATTNGFYLASNFHDYLAKKPIGFTRSAGNFSAAGGDPVILNTLDGAATDGNMPDADHIDNANMTTPPDGYPPTMQMYLFHAAYANDTGAFPTGDQFVPTTGSLDASVEYHEYTHGLSNRLVVDPSGFGALNTIQSGSMGEAWSDYYAMDYLVLKGFLKDTSKPGQLLEGDYVDAGQHLIRTMAIDCPVSARTRGCTSGFDRSVKGGYTYADFGDVIDGPEVHASGEIWGQTLWQIRRALGHTVADTLITRAMSLSPAEPSFLDERNAILQADQIVYGSSHVKTLWKIFANRGMGYFAGSVDSADQTPAADFHVPPGHQPYDGTIAGYVTDPATGDPVQGALVQVTGRSASTTTGQDGFYEMDGVAPGTYKKILVTAPGYLPVAHAGTAVSIGDFGTGDLTDFDLNRDWAAVSGRANVLDFDGPDYTPFGCGPLDAFDMSLSTGWGSVTGDADDDGNGIATNVFKPKSITVKLPTAVDIDSFQVDPAGTCGDDLTASTGHFRIETSTNGSSFNVAAEDTFGTADDGHLNRVDPTGGTGNNVQYVRFTILGNQVPNFATNCPDGPYSGCAYTDLTELAVLGAPSS